VGSHISDPWGVSRTKRNRSAQCMGPAIYWPWGRCTRWNACRRNGTPPRLSEGKKHWESSNTSDGHWRQRVSAFGGKADITGASSNVCF